MQHLSARLARSLRGVFEPLLRAETRVWAEPLVVQRFADYRAERPEGLTAWVPLKMTPGTGRALAVLDAGFVLVMLEIGRAHVCTPVTHAHLVCRFLLETKNIPNIHNHYTFTLQ